MAVFATPPAVVAWYVAARLTYILWVSLALRAQFRRRVFTRRLGAEGGYRRFRAITTILMNHDAASFAVLCWVGRGTLDTTLTPAADIAFGVFLIVGGLFVKAWATATLGSGAYYWRSFFVPQQSGRYSVAGPYRWFVNPMYTVGYLPLYGLALALHCWDGLIAAAFAQACILALCVLVEEPHNRALRDAAGHTRVTGRGRRLPAGVFERFARRRR